MTDKQRQHLLAYLGYYVLSVDGDWGKGSQEACRAFQRDRNLTADGFGGPETDKALRHAVYNDLQKTDPADDVDVSATTGTFWDHIKYWSRDEFACRCGEYHAPYCDGFPAEPDQTLVELLDDIRAHFGRPAIRSSGLRCPQHNRDSNGVANSKHLSGKAMDFYVQDTSGDDVRAYAAADPRCNYTYVIEGNYVHVDVG